MRSLLSALPLLAQHRQGSNGASIPTQYSAMTCRRAADRRQQRGTASSARGLPYSRVEQRSVLGRHADRSPPTELENPRSVRLPAPRARSPPLLGKGLGSVPFEAVALVGLEDGGLAGEALGGTKKSMRLVSERRWTTPSNARHPPRPRARSPRAARAAPPRARTRRARRARRAGCRARRKSRYRRGASAASGPRAAQHMHPGRNARMHQCLPVLPNRPRHAYWRRSCSTRLKPT